MKRINMAWIGACLLLQAGLSVAAAQCPPDNRDPKDFVFAPQADLKSLDPYALDETFTLSMLGNVYEGLVKRDPTGAIVEGLATRWEWKDNVTLRFYLRTGVKFQKGQDFTADDVVFSAKRLRSSGSDLKARLPADIKVVKIDDHTVDFVLPSPNPIVNFEWDTWYIVSKPWIELNQPANPEEVDALGFTASQANGTGPFSISQHQAGVRTDFTPNPDWWGTPKPTFKTVFLCSTPDDGDRVDLLLSKKTQLIEPVPPADIQRVKATDGVGVLKPIEDFRIVFLGFNVTDAKLKNSDIDGNPFKDPKVRTAFYQAIDIDKIVSVILGNVAMPTASLIAPSLSAPAGNIVRRPFDPDGARKLLEGAGYPDGFTLEMDCPIGLYIGDEEICKNVRDMLSYIHVTVNLKAKPKDKFLAKVLQSGGYDTSFFLFGWTPKSFDVWNVLFNLVACRDTTTGTGQFNIGGYCDADLDALIGKIRAEPIGTSRDALILEALKKIHDESVYIPLHQQKLIWGGSNDFSFVQRKNNRVLFNEFGKK